MSEINPLIIDKLSDTSRTILNKNIKNDDLINEFQQKSKIRCMGLLNKIYIILVILFVMYYLCKVLKKGNRDIKIYKCDNEITIGKKEKKVCTCENINLDLDTMDSDLFIDTSEPSSPFEQEVDVTIPIKSVIYSRPPTNMDLDVIGEI